MKYINFLIIALSLIGTYYYKDSDDNLIKLTFIVIFILGEISSYFTNKKEAELKIESGKTKAIIKNYRYHDSGFILLSVVGSIILAFTIYEYFKSNNLESMNLILGLASLSFPFKNVSKYFITIDDKQFKIKGTIYKIKNISQILFTTEKIVMHKTSSSKEFSMHKLSESEKKEVYKFLINSSVGDKVSIADPTNE